MERDCTFNFFFLVTLTFNNVSESSRSNAKKKAKFHFTPIFCGLEKSICYPFDSHKILQTCAKIYTLTVPIGYFIVLGPRTKYLVIEVQANFQKSVHWSIIQVLSLFFFQILVLSYNHHKSYFFK